MKRGSPLFLFFYPLIFWREITPRKSDSLNASSKMFISVETFVNIETRLVHLDVEVSSEELLAPALLCHKEPASSKQNTPSIP